LLSAGIFIALLPARSGVVFPVIFKTSATKLALVNAAPSWSKTYGPFPILALIAGVLA